MKRKQNLLLGVLVLSMGFGLVSCGTHKTANMTASGQKKIETKENECERKSLESSEYLRGFGVAVSPDKQEARNISFAEARNEILNQLKVCASNVIKRYRKSNESDRVGGLDGAMARTHIGKAENMILQVAEETISGARPICVKTYIIGYNYEVNSCVELTNKNYLSDLYKIMSENEALRIDFEEQRFKKEFKEELEKYRKQKRGY